MQRPRVPFTAHPGRHPQGRWGQTGGRGRPAWEEKLPVLFQRLERSPGCGGERDRRKEAAAVVQSKPGEGSPTRGRGSGQGEVEGVEERSGAGGPDWLMTQSRWGLAWQRPEEEFGCPTC